MAYLNRLISKIFFNDITPLIRRGAKTSLTAEDMPALLPSLDPKRNWIKDEGVDWSRGTRILRTLLLSDGRLWLAPSLLYASSALLSLTGPVLVNLFVKRLQTGLHDSEALTYAVVYGLAIGLSGILSGLCMQHYFLCQLRRAQMFVNRINTKVFRHALSLSKEARENIPIGDIVNHLSTDTDSISEIANALSDLVYCILMIGGAVGLLFYYLGSTAWIAVALLTLLVPITKRVSRNFVRFEEDLMRHRDRRVTLMSQILSAIRLVKYFGWESSVRQEVATVRMNELRSRKRIAQAELTVTMIYVSVGTLVLFAVLALHGWRGGVFDAALTFTCVSLFSLLEDPFAFIAKIISSFINAKVGADRVAGFLRQPCVASARGSVEECTGHIGFRMEEFSAFLGKEKFQALRNINLVLEPGQSLAIVGPVGSGKSTFLSALLGEVENTSGHLNFYEKSGLAVKQVGIGYVPQEAYILNGTLRENLLFGGKERSLAEIERALALAGLTPDIARIAGGLEAEIGEKGINLSGGQRQRLSLARAVLHRPQLVVLDDPLSAVDGDTERLLTERLLSGEWRNVTKVMVTHRLSPLEHFEQIAFLQQGELKGLGTLAELLASCPEFQAFTKELESHSRAESASDRATENVTTSIREEEAQRITVDEERSRGAVSRGVYTDYIFSLGGENMSLRPWILGLLGLAAISGTFFPLLQKAWLARMSNLQTCHDCRVPTALLDQWAAKPLTAILIYGLLGLLIMAATLAADLFWLRRGLKAGRDIHDRMLDSILAAKLRFFDSTPVGRILQRFSRDMEAIDVQLQWSFETSMKCLAQVLVTLAVIEFALPWIVIVLVPVLYVYYRVQKLYRASAREAKRLDSIARSPRYAHFKETLQGLTVIRAYGRSDWFLEEFYKRLTHSQRMFSGHYLTNRWFSSRVPVIGGLVSLFTAMGIVASVRLGHLSPGVAGLLTVYSLSFWGVLNWGIRIWSEVEARMTSMERVKYYSRLTPEIETVSELKIPSDWPAEVRVQFDNVSARYASHLPLVLQGLSFQVKPGERVGVIGRTGSGKSTIFQVLYRFLEIEKGSVKIDGIDITQVPLERLRKAMAIIPQDPTLFLGTVRSNLDRYGRFRDDQIWRVLERTALYETVKQLPGGLNAPCHENGANFSQGQRQLLCLARALLMEAKVIIIDEATASVDVQTDAKVQAILREACAGITMLIIAHRMNTIKDCAQILEIREGRLVEEPGSVAGRVISRELI